MWTLHKLKQQQRRRHEAVPSTSAVPEAQVRLGEGSNVENSQERGSRKDAPEAAQSTVLESQLAHALDVEENGLSSPWEFSQDDLARFPALRKRNFWCVQRHQARALHYDLRMQLDGGTVSWAIPKGLLGISKRAEKNRMAVETTIHPIGYTTYEGGDGRILPSGERCGTLLWDVGEYTVDYPYIKDYDSDSENEKRRKKRRLDRVGYTSEGSDDPLGRFEEDKFRLALGRPSRVGKAQSIHFTLKGGRKLTSHSYILLLTPQGTISSTYSSTGRQKRTWFISLPRGVEEYLWGDQGEEGEQYGRSVKSGKTLRQVCAEGRTGLTTWKSEKDRYKGWGDDDDEIT